MDDTAQLDRLSRADDAAREQIARVEGLLEALERLPDPAARELATEVLGALLDLYGEGLGRIVEVLAAHDGDGALAEQLANDELVAHLLLLHGLHPVPVEERVRGALAEVLPYLESHGGAVELVAVEDGIARVRLRGQLLGLPLLCRDAEARGRGGDLQGCARRAARCAPRRTRPPSRPGSRCPP